MNYSIFFSLKQSLKYTALSIFSKSNLIVYAISCFLVMIPPLFTERFWFYYCLFLIVLGLVIFIITVTTFFRLFKLWLPKYRPSLSDADTIMEIIRQTGYQNMKDIAEAYHSVREEMRKNKIFWFFFSLELIVKLPFVISFLIKEIIYRKIFKKDSYEVLPLKTIYDYKLNQKQIDFLESKGFHFQVYIKYRKLFNDYISYEDWMIDLIRNYKV